MNNYYNGDPQMYIPQQDNGNPQMYIPQQQNNAEQQMYMQQQQSQNNGDQQQYMQQQQQQPSNSDPQMYMPQQKLQDNGESQMYVPSQQQIPNGDQQQQMYMHQQSQQIPGPIQDMYHQQMRMQNNHFLEQQKMANKRAICFSTEMINQMSKSVHSGEFDSPQKWHQNFEQSQSLKSNPKKRKLPSSGNSYSPAYNGNMQQPLQDYNQPPQSSAMPDFQQPMSMSSNPPSVHDPNHASSMNGMMPKTPYMKQEIKKDEDDPLRGLERMTNQTLDPATNKGLIQRNDIKKQEDKKVKLAKLDTLATSLNLQEQNNMRMPMPIGGPGMGNMMMHPNMRPFMQPGFDPNMRMMGMPQMMYPPNSAMVSPGMHPMQASPAHMSPGIMQPPPYGVGAPSPKYGANMINRAPFNPVDGMPRPMNALPPEMQQQIWMQRAQQQHQQQMMKQQEVAAGGMYTQ